MPSLAFEMLSPVVNLLPEKLRIQTLCLYKSRRLPNLESPQSFNDKIQWRKLNEKGSKLSTLVDKLAVKNYINSLGVDVIVPSVIWRGNSFSSINFDDFPENYVLKANHASGTNYIVQGKEHPSQKLLASMERRWKSIDISKTFVERAYSEVPVKFFAEEFLDFGTFVPLDYKFWVFHGKVAFVQVDSDRFSDHRRTFFDASWRELPFSLTYPKLEDVVPKPDNFEDMIIIANKIAASTGLGFVRVDLYSDGSNVYFGEITLYPGGGYENFVPRTADFEVGSLWRL